MNPVLVDIPTEMITDRLVLRVPRPGDGAIVYPTVRDSLSELKRWMPWATDDYDLQNAEEWCRRNAAKFLTREELAFLMFMKGGEHVGNLSAFKFDWNVPRCEIGYWLATNHCGHGYMTEAVAAVTDLALVMLKCERVEIRADEENDRSWRVAERAGFVLEGVLRHDRRDNAGGIRGTAIFARIR